MARPPKRGSSDNLLWAAARAQGQRRAPRPYDYDEEGERHFPRSGSDEQIEDRLRRGMSQTAIRAELGCGQERVQQAAKRLGITMRAGKRHGHAVGVREYKTFRTGSTSMLRGTVGLPDDWKTFTAHYDEIAGAVVLRARQLHEAPVREVPAVVLPTSCPACDGDVDAGHAYACPHFAVKRGRKKKA